MLKVLHVGCGRKDIRGMPPFFQNGRWSEIRLDIDPEVQPDVIGTITDLSVIATGSVQAVFSSHNLEHLYPHEVPPALVEFRRVLSADGFALITCPDLQSVAALIAQDRLLEPAYQSGMGPISPIDIVYGHRASVAGGNHFMAHRCGFTARTLLQALGSVGFGGVLTKRRPAHFDLWSIAAASNPGQDKLRQAAERLFPR